MLGTHEARDVAIPGRSTAPVARYVVLFQLYRYPALRHISNTVEQRGQANI